MSDSIGGKSRLIQFNSDGERSVELGVDTDTEAETKAGNNASSLRYFVYIALTISAATFVYFGAIRPSSAPENPEFTHLVGCIEDFEDGSSAFVEC